MEKTITLRKLVNDNFRRIWYNKSDQHIKESYAKAVRFCDFNGFGDREVVSFNVNDLFDFIEHLEQQGIGDNTLNHYNANISSIFKYALDLRLIDHKPSIPNRKVITGRPRYMSNEEMEQLLSHKWDAHAWWMEHMIILAMHTGMRRGEILSIKPEMCVREHGKEWVDLARTKNGTVRRVALDDAACKALKALSFQPSRHHTQSTFYNQWDKARRKIAPNDDYFVFHAIRHTVATKLATEQNLNAVVLQKIMGHKSLETTSRYVHLNQNDQHTYIEQLWTPRGAA